MTLDEARTRIGYRVTYQADGSEPENGEITGVSSTTVFVRYTGDHAAKATSPADLTLVGPGIRVLLAQADDALVQALTATGRAGTAIEELVRCADDIELAATTEGPDALAELYQAALSLRNAHRIIAHRKRMLDKEG